MAECGEESEVATYNCCVCQGNVQSHFCFKCRSPCHPFCGKVDRENEGYGTTLTCPHCEEAEELQDVEMTIPGIKVKMNTSLL